MKKASQYLIATLSGLCLACLLQSCPSQRMMVNTLGGNITGTWEWVKTTTPTRTFTPQSVGYTKQLAVLTDNIGRYAAFYKNDTLQHRLNETTKDTNHTFIDVNRQTVLIKYGGAGFIKYLVTNTGNSTMITASEVLNPYNIQADTVHSLYKRTSKALYPY